MTGVPRVSRKEECFFRSRFMNLLKCFLSQDMLTRENENENVAPNVLSFTFIFLVTNSPITPYSCSWPKSESFKTIMWNVFMKDERFYITMISQSLLPHWRHLPTVSSLSHWQAVQINLAISSSNTSSSGSGYSLLLESILKWNTISQ